MTLLEIRKWQIEQALAVDSKWSESVRHCSERILLTGVALLVAVLTYPEKIGLDPSDIRFRPMLLAIGGAILFSGILYFCAAAAQNEATKRIAPHIEKLGQDDNVVVVPWTSTRLQRRIYRSLVALSVLTLVAGFSLAGSMVLWRGSPY